eukprot:gene3695-4604_t
MSSEEIIKGDRSTQLQKRKKSLTSASSLLKKEEVSPQTTTSITGTTPLKKRSKSLGGTTTTTSTTSSSLTSSLSSSTSTTAVVEKNKEKDDIVKLHSKAAFKRKSIEPDNIFQIDRVREEEEEEKQKKKRRSLSSASLTSLTSSTSAPSSSLKSSTTTSSTTGSALPEKKKRTSIASAKKVKLTSNIEDEEKATEDLYSSVSALKKKQQQQQQQASTTTTTTKSTKEKEKVVLSNDDDHEFFFKDENDYSDILKSKQSRVEEIEDEDEVVYNNNNNNNHDDNLKEEEEEEDEGMLMMEDDIVIVSANDNDLKHEQQIQKDRLHESNKKKQTTISEKPIPTTSTTTTTTTSTARPTKQYPKTPLPSKKMENYYTPSQTFNDSPSLSSVDYRSTSKLNTTKTPSYQHSYPASPVASSEGFIYSDSPVSIPNISNISFLSPNDRDISFDTDNVEYFVPSPPPKHFTYQQQQQQDQDSSSFNTNNKPKVEKESILRHILMVGSFIYWVAVLIVLFNFYYHFNDIRYCDSIVNNNSRSNVDGTYICAVCPDKGICSNEQFVGCIEGYVKRKDECILDPSKSESLVNAVTQIENILKDQKGRFECGISPLLSMDEAQLEKEYNSRFWLKSKEITDSFDEVIHLVKSDEDPEAKGLDKKLIASIKYEAIDGISHFSTTEDPNRPLWCQSYFFIKGFLMRNLLFIGVLALGYSIYKYMVHMNKKKQEELLLIEQFTKKIYKILQDRKMYYEEPWISEIILKDDVIGSTKDKRLNRIWEKSLEKVYENVRVLATPKLVHGESQQTLEWKDAQPTPRKSLLKRQQPRVEEIQDDENDSFIFEYEPQQQQQQE